MNLPFFAVEAYVPGGGGGVQNQAEKNAKNCLPASTGTKIFFSSLVDFFGGGALSLGKSTQKSTAKIQIRISELRAQNPHCKNLPLISVATPADPCGETII